MSELETLKFEVVDGIGHVTLHRPDNANALNPAMAEDLLEVAVACDEDPAVRAVLIDSVGRIFCAGGDLAEFSKAGAEMPKLLNMPRYRTGCKPLSRSWKENISVCRI